MDTGEWLREYERVLSLVKLRAEDCDETILDHHLPFLERLDAVDGSSVALYDLRARAYRFITSSFRFLGGYPRDEALAEGPDYFFRLMHAPDLAFALETITRTFGFLFSLPAEERKDYKLSFEFRIKSASGGLVRILQQVVALELDARGNIWLGLVASGLASKEIADSLFISVATVNNHRQRILEKLGTRSSAEAVRYAAALGLV